MWTVIRRACAPREVTKGLLLVAFAQLLVSIGSVLGLLLSPGRDLKAFPAMIAVCALVVAACLAGLRLNPVGAYRKQLASSIEN